MSRRTQIHDMQFALDRVREDLAMLREDDMAGRRLRDTKYSHVNREMAQLSEMFRSMLAAEDAPVERAA